MRTGSLPSVTDRGSSSTSRPAASFALGLAGEQRLATDEVDRLVGAHGEPEAGLVGRLLGRDVGAHAR
jgi:hypothetical protein